VDVDRRREIYAEVVVAYETLENDRPGRYTGQLANALTLLVDILGESGRRYRAEWERRRQQADELQRRDGDANGGPADRG